MDIIQLIITSIAFLFFTTHWVIKIKKIQPATYEYLKDIIRRYFSLLYFGFIVYFVIIPNLALNQYLELFQQHSHKITLSNNASETQYYLFKQKLDTSGYWLLSTYSDMISHDFIFSLDSGETKDFTIGNYSVPVDKTIIENISDSLQTDSTIKAAAFTNIGSKLLCRHSDLKDNFVKQDVSYANIYIELFSLFTTILGSMLFFFHGKKLLQKIIINSVSFTLAGLSLFFMLDKIRILLYYYFGVLI